MLLALFRENEYAEESTYPAATHGHVQDNVVRLVSKIRPSSFRKAATRDRVKDIPVHGPLDGLCFPVPACPVPFKTPDMRPIIRNGDAGLQSLVGIIIIALIATMHGPIARQDAVDRLEDIEFATRGPRLGTGPVRLW